MYVSSCAAHYFRQQFEGMGRADLMAQRLVLRDSLRGLDEQVAEVAALGGREAAKLRASIEGEAMMLRAKLAAVEELLLREND